MECNFISNDFRDKFLKSFKNSINEFKLVNQNLFFKSSIKNVYKLVYIFTYTNLTDPHPSQLSMPTKMQSAKIQLYSIKKGSSWFKFSMLYWAW